MSTGNDQYAEHLRGQLTAVLDDITPSPAPAGAIKRRGKAIRSRRRVGVAVGLGVAVVAAALVPSLMRLSAAPTPTGPRPIHPKVTVGFVGRGAPHGLIAEGAINGKKWRITLSWYAKQLCVGTSGEVPQAGCGPLSSYAATWPATIDASGGGSTNALFGIVATQVSRVSVELSDGVVLDLQPVRFSRYRWIGVELPTKLAVVNAVAYSRSRELAYAIPFTAKQGAMPSFAAWLRPGELPPRAFVRVIGAGVVNGQRWSVSVHVGPWGQCAVVAIPGDSGSGGCWSATTRQPGLIIGSSGWDMGATRPRVSYLVLSMTDGSTRRVPVVRVGDERLYAIVTLRGPRIARWAAYDASGHRLYGGRGAPGFGHS
jgi:hypothetical protein